MASGIYNRFKANLMEANCDLANGGDTIKVALLDNSHSFNADDDTWSDVSTNEISGTGYTAGGAALANQSVTEDDADDLAKFDGDDAAWTNASFTANHAVLYDDTMANDDLICSFDFGGPQQVTSGTFTIQWNASGILTLS
jgi:hypothetical protein